MNIFIDTSALIAVLNGDDSNHQAAKPLWERIISAGDVLVCHNYILVETSALASRRLGMEAVLVFEQDIVPILSVVWVSREVHNAAASAHLVAARRMLSLVDCVSFEIMRRTGVRTAFAFAVIFRFSPSKVSLIYLKEHSDLEHWNLPRELREVPKEPEALLAPWTASATTSPRS